jgi:hypothetical protein
MGRRFHALPGRDAMYDEAIKSFILRAGRTSDRDLFYGPHDIQTIFLAVNNKLCQLVPGVGERHQMFAEGVTIGVVLTELGKEEYEKLTSKEPT